jgi:hypothetical protein
MKFIGSAAVAVTVLWFVDELFNDARFTLAATSAASPRINQISFLSGTGADRRRARRVDARAMG